MLKHLVSHANNVNSIQTWIKTVNSTEHGWQAKCKANYHGSSPAMESEGAERMFGRSIEKHKLRYSELYADGDSKSHSQIENIYADGKTQNQNESFNGMLWQRVPKEVYVGRNVLEFGLYDAISHFNGGSSTVLTLYESLEIPPGKYTEEGCRFLDYERIHGAEYKEMERTKKRRKVLRGQKKKKDDKKQQAEGITYAAGAF